MDEKLIALALLRASITEDAETITAILTQHPLTPDLARHLAGIGASILEVGVGREQAMKTVDKFLRLTLAGEG